MDKTFMTTQDTLMAFSEWLDGEGIAVCKTSDKRSHDDLARQFVEHWESDPRRGILAGRVTTYATTYIMDSIQEFADKFEKTLGVQP